MLVEIFISALFAGLVLVDAGLLLFGHRWGSGLRLGFVGLLAVVFGLYLQVRYGMILDYGSSAEIQDSHAMAMYTLGFVLQVLGGIPVLGAGLRIIFWLAARLLKKP